MKPMFYTYTVVYFLFHLQLIYWQDVWILHIDLKFSSIYNEIMNKKDMEIVHFGYSLGYSCLKWNPK